MDDELLMAYFKGEVSDEEAQRITEWIEAKIEHQRLRVILSNQRNDFHFYTKFFHLLLYFLAA